MYKVILKKQAAKYYAKVDTHLVKLLDFAFSELELLPKSGPRIKLLTGELAGLYRFRVKHLRIVYEINETDSAINVITILPRGDVYK